MGSFLLIFVCGLRGQSVNLYKNVCSPLIMQLHPEADAPIKNSACQILTALICSNSLTGLSKLSPFVKMLPCPHSSATVEAPPAPPPRVI